jgi:hypothetical protein
LRLVREYPREPLLGAVREAGGYGLYDLDLLERTILRTMTEELETAEESQAAAHPGDLWRAVS